MEIKKPKASPAHYENSIPYDPTDMTMKHDAFFSSVAPGVTDSGNLKHKWGEPGAHWSPEEPSSNLKGD